MSALFTPFHTQSWPTAWPLSSYLARYRQQPVDFQVEEVLGFMPTGQGEQVFAWVEKTNLSTAYVAEQLARQAGIHPKAVGFSGLKDRHAVTRQWFSLHLPGQPTPSLEALSGSGWQVQRLLRHPRKLKRGTHRANRFTLRLHLHEVSQTAELFTRATWLAERWALLCRHGIPNYFGPQRFGLNGYNLHLAQQLLQTSHKPLKRQQRSFALSALRSALFNDFLADAIRDARWQQAQEGAIFCLRASRSYFTTETDTDLIELQRRLDGGDIDPSGPLAGMGHPRLTGRAAIEEAAWQARHQQAYQYLVEQGLKAERRPLRIGLVQPRFYLSDTQLDLEFTLPAGSFATAVIAELVQAEDAQLQSGFAPSSPRIESE